MPKKDTKKSKTTASDALNTLKKLKCFAADSKTQLSNLTDPDNALEFTKAFYQNLIDVNEDKGTRKEEITNSKGETELVDIDWDKRRLDSLARLITFDSQCAAICFDKKDKLLISYNEVHNGKNAVKESKEDTARTTKYINHVNKVMGYLSKIAKGEYEIDDDTKKQRAIDRDDIIKSAGQYYYKGNQDPVHDEKIIGNIERSLNKHQGVLPEEQKAFVDEDTFAAAERARRDLMKLEEALGYKHDYIGTEKLLKEKDNSFFEAFKSANFEIIRDGEDHDKCHAEMRIVQHIADNYKGKESEFYIGLSKLCCGDCHVAINASREVELKFKSKSKNGIEFTTRGNHGQSFEWHMIEVLKENTDYREAFLGEDATRAYNKLNSNDQEIALGTIVQHIGLMGITDARSIGVKIGADKNKKEVGKEKGGVATKSDSEPSEDEKDKAEMREIKTFVRGLKDNIVAQKDDDNFKAALNNAQKQVFDKTDEYKNANKSQLVENLLVKHLKLLRELLVDQSLDKFDKDMIINSSKSCMGKLETLDLNPKIVKESKNFILAFESGTRKQLKSQNLKLSEKKELSALHNIDSSGKNNSSKGYKLRDVLILSNKNNEASLSQLNELMSKHKIANESNTKLPSKSSLLSSLADRFDKLRSFVQYSPDVFTNNTSISDRITEKTDKNDVINRANEISSVGDNKKGKVMLIAENDHSVDHTVIKDKLNSLILAGKIKEGTTVALERKEEGKNLGMSDVMLLANIIRYNDSLNDRGDKTGEQNKQQDVDVNHNITASVNRSDLNMIRTSDKLTTQMIVVPESVQKSAIYADALLYNTASNKGISVVGIDTYSSKLDANNLSRSIQSFDMQIEVAKEAKIEKGSQAHNVIREEAMANNIEQLSLAGTNVIFLVGSSHTNRLQEMLEERGVEIKVKDITNTQSVKSESHSKSESNNRTQQEQDRMRQVLSIDPTAAKSFSDAIHDTSSVSVTNQTNKHSSKKAANTR